MVNKKPVVEIQKVQERVDTKFNTKQAQKDLKSMKALMDFHRIMWTCKFTNAWVPKLTGLRNKGLAICRTLAPL